MKTVASILLVASLFTISIALAQFDDGPGELDLSWFTIDGGGGRSAGGSMIIVGSIDQPDAGSMTGAGFELVGGFWAGNNAPTTPTCIPDIAPSGGDGVVSVPDLLAVINAWGPCPQPANCTADIAPVGGDGVVSVPDLLAVINGWGACP